MNSSIRVELPLRKPSKILSKFKTIGDLKSSYPNLDIVKYIYLDPQDNKLKGVNPPDDIPLVENSYMTIVGDYDEVISFTSDATRE